MNKEKNSRRDQFDEFFGKFMLITTLAAVFLGMLLLLMGEV